MKIKPTKNQLAFLDWEFGIFFHFGIRTFCEGHKDWDMKPMSLEGFNPSRLDAKQWISNVKEAGAKYAVFVTKHHDGFANWPSKYTEYSVANTPWKGGKGDAVKEFVDACRKFDIKVGLYYSPAEFGLKENKKTASEYDDYFINQIKELLTGYGKIDYLWFDGNGSQGHRYDTKRITGEIRKMQPEILLFNMWDPDTRWIGNEYGIASLPYSNVVNSLDIAKETDRPDSVDGYEFLPGECDCRMRYHNWFYSEYDEDTVKNVDELIGLYYSSVGRGANLLINIGPNRHGLLPEKDLESLHAFSRELKRRFANPVCETCNPEPIDNKYTVKFSGKTLVNHLVIEENLTDGEGVKRFKILLRLPTSQYICIYEGKGIGHKNICVFPAVSTDELVVEICDFEDSYAVNRIGAYMV